MIFLRPWFLLLILIPFVFRIFRERLDTSSPWGNVIDEKLLPYLLVKGTSASAKKRSIYKTILWGFLCFALAGPAWEKESVPTQTTETGTVIVLEISQVLSGQNLIRAQQKIYDILNYLEGEQVGLVLYDRFGYTAGPLTFELDIIRDMVPSLDISLLQEQILNPNAGFDQANQILENAGIKEGRILFLTSGIGWPNDFISNAKKYNHKIGVLGIGSETPYPIALKTGGFLLDEKNQPVMVSLDRKKMSQLGEYHPMSPDDKDIQYLLENTPVEETERHVSGQEIAIWKDMGGYFILAILPFFALLFRKGVLMGLLLFYGLSAEASLWRRPDQEAYDKQMIGVQNYQAKFYERAEGIFKSGKNVDDIYNYGNALAFQQKIEEAIKVYQNALAKDPKHEDARFNKEYLEKKLEEEKKRREEEKKKQEQQQREKEQQEKLNQLQDLLKQEENLKQQELEELEKQQRPQDDLADLKEKLQQELEQKKKQQEQISEISQKNKEAMQQKLKELEQELHEEIQQKQEQIEQLEMSADMEKLTQQFQEENEIKHQELNNIQKILPKEEMKPEPHEEKTEVQNIQRQMPENGIEEKKIQPEEQPNAEKKQEQMPETEVFDQKSQEILNHLEQDPDSILRYRIRQQYLRRLGV